MDALEIAKGMARERSKSLLVSNLRDHMKKDKNLIPLLMPGFTSSSLSNLRIPPGSDSLSNAVRLRQHLAHSRIIAEDEKSNHSEEISTFKKDEKVPEVGR